MTKQNTSTSGEFEAETPSIFEQQLALAKYMHYEYELIAGRHKWQTQKTTRVDFAELPDANKATMLELAGQIVEAHHAELERYGREQVRGRLQDLLRFQEGNWVGVSFIHKALAELTEGEQHGR